MERFMPSTVLNIAFDCSDPYHLALFWSEVTGCPISVEDNPGDPEASVPQRDGTNLWFNRVPEPKSIKNRVHVCLKPDVARDVEVARLLEVGATMVADRRKPDGSGWAVLADPEGNEFCVLRSDAEHIGGDG
jgi:predicted enzyme related to lactoylglutathione lyase